MAAVSQEMIEDFVVRRRQGESLRSIARLHGVDPRTVSARIQKAEAANDEQHWKSVTLQVDASYLREHHQTLVKAASSLLGAISIEPLNVLGTWIPEKWIEGKLRIDPLAVDEASNGLLSGLQASTAKERTALERMGLKVLGGLLEHEAKIDDALKQWKSNWAEWQSRRDELIEAARGLLRREGIEVSQGGALAENLVQDVLLTRFTGKQQGELVIEDAEGDNGDHQAELFFRDESTSKKLLVGQGQQFDPIIESYDLVWDQIAHEARMGPMGESLGRFSQSVKELENMIDGLILRRRPQGKCQFCPR